MKTQGWILTIYIFLILIAEWTRSVSAAQFLKSLQNNMCLQRASNSTSGCFLISTSPCPTDRFGSIPDSSQWNIIPSNPASPSDFFIQSTDNKLCLVTDGSNTAQVCACDSGSVSQRLILDNGNLKNGQSCLAAIGNSAGLSTCNTGLQWKAYPVAPDTVNVYIGTSFTQKKIPLSLNNYTSSDLPAEIYSSAFSMEIPPGFQFIIHKNNKNNTVYENDMSQVNPIDDLTSTVEIKLKPGMVIYENAAYFGASQFLPNGNTTTATQDSPMMVGSAMVPTGFRGITWQSSGGNFVVYEPVTNFSVIAENAKVSAASVDISAATCSSECASGGYCSGNNQCTCKPGFTGTQCDQCLPGFYGPMCQGCPSSCNNSTNHFLCDDGISGTGTCKSQCAPGFAGSNCTTCAPGYFGSDCKPCNCGNGTCDNKGTCICNAGWTSNNCTVTMPGYYINSDGNARACSPGCSVCASPDGTCTQCSSDLLKQSTDNPQNCVPINPTTQCDSTCQTCYGPDATNCLTCASPRYLLAGSCVQIQLDNSGTCVVPSGNGVYFVDTQQGLCEPCPKNCLSCQFPSFTPASPPTDMKCSKCNPGTFLNDGKCVNVCPPGKYVDPTNNMTCSACNQNCASCTGPSETQCLSCSDNTHFALNGTCSTKKCPSSYATINTTCTPCHPDCGQCSGPSFDQCTKCPSNRPILKDGQCIPACAKGKYADENGTCQPCNSECSSCVGPKSNQCLGCSDMTKVLSGGSCAVCPAGNKLLQSERLCQRIESDNLVGNVEQPDSSKKSMPWWVILLIIIGVVLVLCVCVCCFRRCMIKRRKKKTQEFGDKIDNNMVSKHLAELAGVSVSQPEPSYRALSKSALKPREYDEMGEAPPVYEPEDAKNWEDIKLWEELKRKSSRIGRKKKNDWDGFELVSNEGGAVPNRSSNGPNHWGKNWI